ncbi:MAG: HNH endonuclease [archaeon]
MNGVIVLNADYTFINFCNWKRALILVEQGKAEVLKASEKIVHNFEKTFSFAIPYIIKLVKMIRKVYKRRVPFNKSNVFVRDDYTCQYCGKKLKNPELEHIVPKSRGGKSTFSNCVAACKECNRSKGDRLPSESGFYLKRQPTQPTIHEFLKKKMEQITGVSDILDELFREYTTE